MRALSLALWLAPILTSSLAYADEDPQRRAQAEMRFREGLALHADGKEREARIRFEEAYAILGDNPNILMNLAREEQLTGDEALAARHYRECLKSEKLNDKGRGLATKFLAELQNTLAQLSILAPNGTSVWIDGKGTQAPLEETIYVKPGVHSLVARLGKDEQRTDGVEAAPAAVTTVRFFQGTRFVTGAPSSRADSKAEPPAAPPAVPMTASGDRVHFWTPTRMAGAGLTVLAVASLSVGIGFGLDANAKHDDWVNLSGAQASTSACTGVQSDRCASLASLQSTQRNDAVWSTAGFVGAGVCAAGAAVFWFFPAPKEHLKGTSFSVAPALGRGAPGIVAIGSF